MPIYDFGEEIPLPVPTLPSGEELGPTHIPAVAQLSEAQGGRTKIDGSPLQNVPSYVNEFIIPGFRALDGALRKYWSGIRVPTKDSYRFMRVKVAGGDRSLLIWNDDLKGGRTYLPVAAIDRTGHEFNAAKYSPNTTHPMAIRYPSRRGDLAIQIFRPVPFLVNYNLLVWAERKRDADYILYQVLTRFNPLAEFRMYDGHLQGTVTLRYNGSSDTSDKEVGADQYANVRYEVSFIAEAWLPLPERTVKTVLGQINLIQERIGEILLAQLGSGGIITEPKP